MDISMESFHVGGEKCGALLRRTGLRQVRTLAVWRTPDEFYRADHSLEHDGDVRRWTSWTLTDATGSTSARRTSPTTVEVDGTEVTVPEDTLPTWAETAVLADMLAGSHTEAEFHEMVESDAAAAPRPAHFSVGNPERVDVPGQGPRELGTVVLYRGDEAAQKFWFDSHEVVLSDWQGATSRHVESVDDLLTGLDDEVAAAVKEFLA